MERGQAYRLAQLMKVVFIVSLYKLLTLIKKFVKFIIILEEAGLYSRVWALVESAEKFVSLTLLLLSLVQVIDNQCSTTQMFD